MVGRSERRHSGRVLILSLAIGAIAALPGHALGASATDSETLTRAQVIGAEVDARYRKLAVTEVTTTGVVESLTLVEGGLEPLRVVPAANGIYFALCAARARCPYPVRSAVWRMGAALPRRVAVELALRTFLETSATLVVVALPTAEPVWLLFERDDFLRAASASQPLDRFDDPLVDLLTRPRLYLPLPILPPPKDTLFALRVSMP
jgi:hypothetical protein